MVQVTRGRGNHFAHLEDVNDREESVREELPATYQAHSEAQFASLRKQIVALTKLLSIGSGRDKRRHIPSPHESEEEDARVEHEDGNPFAECGVHRQQLLVQAQANRWESSFKLDIPEFQGCFKPKEFLVTEKIEKIKKKKVPREAAEIRSQSVVEKEDRFIEEDFLVDWASPPIYDTYPDKEVNFIHQVDFHGVNAILSKTFNQSCDEIYGVETTFLSKSEGVFVSSLGILMAYGKGKAQEKHDKFTWQNGVWGFHDKHQGMSMMKNTTFIKGCGHVVILRSGEWNELTGHPKDRGKDGLNSKANSLQPREDDVDQDGLSYLLGFYLNKVYLLVFYSILSLSLLFELGFFVSLLFGLVFFRRLLN
jgi:hypothetical protein